MKPTKPMFDDPDPRATMKKQLSNDLPATMEKFERDYKRRIRFINIAIYFTQGAIIFIFGFLLLVLGKMIFELIKIKF